MVLSANLFIGGNCEIIYLYIYILYYIILYYIIYINNVYIYNDIQPIDEVQLSLADGRP